MKLPPVKGFDQNALEKYVKNTGWIMFGKLLSLFVGLVVARYLGPSAFGDLSFSIALVGILSAVGSLGLDTFIIREIIQEPAKKTEILGTALWLRIGVYLLLIPVGLIVYLIYFNYFEGEGKPLTLMVALLGFASFFKAFNVIDSYFQSQVQSKHVVKVQNICLLLSAALKIWIVSFGLPLIYLAWSFVFDGFILAAGLTIIYQKKEHNIFDWHFNKQRASALLKQSFPLILSAVMVSLYMQIDQVMLKTVSSEAVGVYSAAAKLSEAWYFIPIAIVTSVFPALINARKTDIDRYQKRLTNLYDLMVWLSLPVAIFISIFAQDIIHLVYGDKFEGAGEILAIHIWSGVFVFLGSASSQYLIAEGYTKISFYRTLAGAITNIALNLWLIPLYTGLGASIATLIACFVSAFYLLLIPKTRNQGISMLKSLFLISLIHKIFKR